MMEFEFKRLQDVLQDCKEGDLLECADGYLSPVFTTGRKYRVKNCMYGLYVSSDDGNFRRSSLVPFVLADKKPKQAEEEHDTWGIGKQYKAPKKEWQPDVMDVDLTKKIWEW